MGDVALRDITFDELQVWTSGLSAAGGSTRFAKAWPVGLAGDPGAPGRQRRASQFAVRSRFVAVNPAEGIELPDKSEAEQRYPRTRQRTDSRSPAGAIAR